LRTCVCARSTTALSLSLTAFVGVNISLSAEDMPVSMHASLSQICYEPLNYINDLVRRDLEADETIITVQLEHTYVRGLLSGNKFGVYILTASILSLRLSSLFEWPVTGNRSATWFTAIPKGTI
jgi:hypothetical protein